MSTMAICKFSASPCVVAGFVLCLFFDLSMSAHAGAQTPSPATANGSTPGTQVRPPEESPAKIEAPFTLTVVGDLQGPRAPIMRLDQPGMQNLLKLLRDGDV